MNDPLHAPDDVLHPPPGIDCRGLRRSFGTVHAVINMDVLAVPGQVTALVGPNGSGKTTLLLMLAGLLKPDAGSIRIAGLDPTTHNRAVRAHLGWMPDTFGTWDSLTSREVLTTVGAAYQLDREHAAHRAEELLDLVHLSELADTPAHVLSRGQKQRLGLARALVHDPQVLLLDEPANGMDPRSRVELRHLVRALADSGKTILISSHILSELEEMTDTAIFVSQGCTVPATNVDMLRRSLPWRIRALDPAALTQWLTTAGVPFTVDAGHIHVSVTDDAAAAQLLRDAIGHEVPVVSFHPAASSLEQTYLALEDDRR